MLFETDDDKESGYSVSVVSEGIPQHTDPVRSLSENVLRSDYVCVRLFCACDHDRMHLD